MPTLAIPLKDILADPVDLAALPEAEAPAHRNGSYGLCEPLPTRRTQLQKS